MRSTIPALSGCLAALCMGATACAPEETSVVQTPPEVQPPTSVPAVPDKPAIAPAPNPGERAPAPTLVTIHRDSDKELRDLFDAQLAVAEESGQTPVVMFTADWCSPCRSIKEALETNPVVRRHTSKARFLLIDVDEWRGPAQGLIPGTDASKLPLIVRVDGQGNAVTQAHGSRLGLLDPQTTGANLARIIGGENIVPPAYQEDKDRRRALAIADSKRQKEQVEGRPPFKMEVVSRVKLPGGGERLRVNLIIHNNEGPRRYWTLPSHVALPEGPVEVPRLSVSRFEEHIRAGYFTYHTDPPVSVIAAGNWGSMELQGYSLDVPEGTQQLAVHKLKQITVGGERATFTKKVPYELKIKDASSLVPGRSVDNPGSLVLEVAESFSAPLSPQVPGDP